MSFAVDIDNRSKLLHANKFFLFEEILEFFLLVCVWRFSRRAPRLAVCAGRRQRALDQHGLGLFVLDKDADALYRRFWLRFQETYRGKTLEIDVNVCSHYG